MVDRDASTGGASRRLTGGTVEAVLGILILHIVGMFAPAQWDWAHLQPHPLWIVVLAIAARYSSPAGYLVGFLAACSYIGALWIDPQTPFQPLYAHSFIQPFLFIVGGGAVSEIVRGHRQRLVRMEQQYTQTHADLQGVTQRYQATVDIKQELEKRIVGQPASVAMLGEAALRLETLHVAELYPALLDLVVKYLEAPACALYILQDGEFRLVHGCPEESPGRLPTLDAHTEIVAEVLRTCQPITVRDRLLEIGPTALAHEPFVMAGPLLVNDEEIYGIVVVERLPFLKFTPTTIGLFTLILNFGSAALHNALTHERLLKLNHDDQEAAQLVPDMMASVRSEFLRAQRYQLPLSVIIVQINKFAEIDPALQPQALHAIRVILRRRLRTVDLIGNHPDGDKLVLVLPMTPYARAYESAQRLHAALAAFQLRPYQSQDLLSVCFGIGAFSWEQDTPEALLTNALNDVREYEPSTGPATGHLVDDAVPHATTIPLTEFLAQPDLSLAASHTMNYRYRA